MNKNTNYTINFETEEIIITKKFGKAASQIGTPEFKVMQQLRKEFAGFSFAYKTIEKKENKSPTKDWALMKWQDLFLTEQKLNRKCLKRS